MKIKTLSCSFSKHIYLIYNCDESGYIKFLKKNYEIERDVTGALGKTFSIDVPWLKVYVWINEKQKPIEIIKTVYHEVYHCIVFLFNSRGINLKDSDGEICCLLSRCWFTAGVFHFYFKPYPIY